MASWICVSMAEVFAMAMVLGFSKEWKWSRFWTGILSAATAALLLGFGYWLTSAVPEEAGRARLLVTEVKILKYDEGHARLPINVYTKNNGAISFSSLTYSYGTIPANAPLSDSQIDDAFALLNRGESGKDSDQVQPAEATWMTLFAYPTTAEMQDLASGNRELYVMIRFMYHDNFGRLETEYCVAVHNSGVAGRCNGHNETRPK